MIIYEVLVRVHVTHHQGHARSENTCTEICLAALDDTDMATDELAAAATKRTVTASMCLDVLAARLPLTLDKRFWGEMM